MIWAKFALCVLFLGFAPTEGRRRGHYLDVEGYLRQYHYLGEGNPSSYIRDLARTDMSMATEMGIRMFQMKWGLSVTGEMNSETSSMMRKPRCGMADIDVMEEMPEGMDSVMGRARQRVRQIADGYMLQGSKWDRERITYRISQYTPDLSREEVDEEIRKAFQLWSDVTPLDFIQVYSTDVDIDIRFAPTSHGDGFDFDGRGGTLAHAFYPQYGGDAHFDESETWTIETHTGINLLQVAAHEFGHALGLRHSEKLGALMYPFYQGYVPDYTLPQDDRDGIQAIYGARYGPVTDRPVTSSPTPTPTPDMPDMCDHGVFDAITTQIINHVSVTHVFSGSYYLQIDPHGIVAGFPRLISDDWPGVTYVDAALTIEYEMYNGAWEYRKVTYLFSGQKYFKFVEMTKVDEGNISDDWDLPAYLDAIFQFSGDGKIYAIKDTTVYTIHNIMNHRADPNYEHSLLDWDDFGRLRRVDGAFMATNDRQMRDTILFADDQYYKIDEDTGKVAYGYPKSTPEGWLGCNGDDSNLLYMNRNRT